MKDSGCIHTKLLCFGERALWCWVTMEWKRSEIIHAVLSARTVTARRSLIHLYQIDTDFTYYIIITDLCILLIILLIYAVYFFSVCVSFSFFCFFFPGEYLFLWASLSYFLLSFLQNNAIVLEGEHNQSTCTWKGQILTQIKALSFSLRFSSSKRKLFLVKLLDRCFSGM